MGTVSLLSDTESDISVSAKGVRPCPEGNNVYDQPCKNIGYAYDYF